MKYRLELNNISKSFGDVHANKNINLQVKKGEIQALLGENGAGKSTLVKMIYGILAPDKGEIYWNNEQIKGNHPDKAKKLGIHMIFQHFSLLDSFTVTQNIAMSIKAQKPTKQLEKTILEVSHKYGLPLEPNKRVLDLSVSEKQRIEIVRSLMQNPKLLIMDEPTSVLNPLEIRSLFSFLKKLRDEGCSILYISHKLEEIMELCDRATILRQGEVITHCNPKKQTKSSLAGMMVGKKLKGLKKGKKKQAKEIFFEIKDLSLKSKDENLSIQNISFAVNKGEIFAIGGVSGNGQQSSIISSSLWLIYKILQPSSRNFFKKLKRERISKGFNTEVGSSIMSSFGFCINERTISIRCFSLTDKSKTLLLGSSGNPYLWETSKIVFSSCLVGF